MERRVEPLAHDLSLMPLRSDLLGTERLQHDESNRDVQTSDVSPDGKDTGAHGAGEVSLLDVQEVGGGVGTSEEDAGLESSLSVVKAVNNGLVFLPAVIFHISSFII